jgi:hypothetical protein
VDTTCLTCPAVGLALPHFSAILRCYEQRALRRSGTRFGESQYL